MILSPESRRQLQESDSKWLVKFILRMVAAVFALIGFSLFAAAIPAWDQNFFHSDGPTAGDWEDGMPIAALVVSFLYNIILSIWMLRSSRSIHPGVNVGVDFIIWGLLIPAITFAAWGGLFRVWRPAVLDANGQVECDILNVFAKECSPILYIVGGLELSGVVFACFVWVLHFTLFVLACTETHKRRMRAKRGGQNFFELNDQYGPNSQLPPYSGKAELEFPGRVATKYT